MCIRIYDVIEATQATFGIARADLLGRCKRRPFARPRQLCCLVAYEIAEGATLPKIGRLLHRDHTTVLHAKRKMEKFIAEGAYTKEYNQIKELALEISQKPRRRAGVEREARMEAVIDMESMGQKQDVGMEQVEG